MKDSNHRSFLKKNTLFQLPNEKQVIFEKGSD